MNDATVRLLEEAKRNVLAAEKLIHEESYSFRPDDAAFWQGHKRGMRCARLYAVRDALDRAIVEELGAPDEPGGVCVTTSHHTTPPEPPDYLNGLAAQMIAAWPDSESDDHFADRLTRAIWYQIVAQGEIEEDVFGRIVTRRRLVVPLANPNTPEEA